MAVQAGMDLLVKVDMTTNGNFETIAGLRATRVSFNTEQIDVTNFDSPGEWRELLVRGGIKSVSISGSGVFRDEATDERMRVLFFDGLTPDFEIIIPHFGTIVGPFQLTSIEYAGQLNGEATYELSIQSAGELNFIEDPTT